MSRSFSQIGLAGLSPVTARLLACLVVFCVILELSLSWCSASGKAWWPAKGDVSLISLIGNPQKFDGQEINTTGIAVIQFEEVMLYVSPYDAEQHIWENGVWLELDSKQFSQWRSLSGQLVQVSGTYRWPRTGSYEMCPNGALTKITRVEHRPKPRPRGLTPR